MQVILTPPGVYSISDSPYKTHRGASEWLERLHLQVFERCFAARVGTVLRGGAASLFCYGYTGGGKTHTTIGYGAGQPWASRSFRRR